MLLIFFYVGHWELGRVQGLERVLGLERVQVLDQVWGSAALGRSLRRHARAEREGASPGDHGQRPTDREGRHVAGAGHMP